MTIKTNLENYGYIYDENKSKFIINAKVYKAED